MSKLIKALEIIRDECDEHFMCDTCPLRYKKDFDGFYDCRLDEWGDTRGLAPREWPIEEVKEMEHND